MEKYPLIGVSICAVVLLILGSLSNVVGYTSVKSTAVNDSPLFKTRTQKATNQQQNILTSQYLGKGKGNLLQFPMRDNRTESLKKAIEYISKMDNKTFSLFLGTILQIKNQNEKLINLDKKTIINDLNQLRQQDYRKLIGHNEYTSEDCTWIDTPTICWFPGCLVFTIIRATLVLSILFTWIFISSRSSTCVLYYTCSGPPDCW